MASDFLGAVPQDAALATGIWELAMEGFTWED
jgi:hypothetical protein